MQLIEIAELLTSQPAVLSSLVVIGLALCLIGYRIFRVYSAVIGFLIGVLAGIYIVVNYYENAVVAILASALAGAVLFALIDEFGLIATGAVFGYFAGLYFLPEYQIYALALAALFGLINLFVEKPMTVIITSVLGASSIALAVHMGITGMHIYDVIADPRRTFDMIFSNMYFNLLWFTLVITGIITQYVAHKEEVEEE
uniref:TMEM198/TM7SF3 family protein n=1 Tax=Archaeoglobus fulgidus TaxID=2234 RepID=A0A7C3MBE1_ARCFL